MILTVTLNASVDITYILKKFQLNTTNRVIDVKKTEGGKGLNVTRVLNQIGEKVLATGIIGGTTGNFIKHSLDAQHIKYHFFEIEQESRNNISIITDNIQTEILEAGPNLTLSNREHFLEFYQQIIKPFSTIVISGSLPQGLSVDFYNNLIESTVKQGKRVLLDTSGLALKTSVSASTKPTLIKPNQYELANLLNRQINPQNKKRLKNDLLLPLFSGIEWIVLSLGYEGAVVKHCENFYEVKVPKIHAINAIGSGDAVIAGLALGIDQNRPIEQIIRQAMTYGVLNALEKEPGFLQLSKSDFVKKEIKISRF